MVPWRDFLPRTGKPGATRLRQPWKPIPIVRVELDPVGLTDALNSQQGDRVWVEATYHRQVVGVKEVVADDHRLSTDTLRDLVDQFADGLPYHQLDVDDRLLPRVTVVVPTICSNPAFLRRTVDSLLAMDYPDFEVIVVDNRESGDPTTFPSFGDDRRVTTATEKKRGISAARNRGIMLATGEVVAFTDDDAVVDERWLRALGQRYALDALIDGVSGIVLPEELSTEPQLWFEEFYGGFSRTFRAETLALSSIGQDDALFPYDAGRFGAGCNMSFRKTTLTRLGGFNEALGTGTPARGGEDLAMFIDVILLGGTLAIEPGAVVRHTHRRTRTEFLHQVRGYGTGLSAMFTALVLRNPRQAIELARRVPAGIRLLTRPREGRSASERAAYPSSTILHQLLGVAYGPVAYLQSLWADRHTS